MVQLADAAWLVAHAIASIVPHANKILQVGNDS